jgi:hypothetical protein
MSDWQHIEINNHGTIVVLRPISDEGRQWFEDNVGEPEPGRVAKAVEILWRRAPSI